jgi:probable HAF family extracellular repeat protein
MKTQLIACLAVMAIVGLAQAALPHSFQGLGDLTGQGLASEARGTSADGTVIVGSSGTPDGQRAFIWTAAAGMVGLPTPTGLGMTWAQDVSPDGHFVVGFGGNGFGSPVGWEGIRWAVSGGTVRIPLAGSGVWAKGVSGDGSIVTGGTGGAVEQAFVWTAAGGLVGLAPPGPGTWRTNAEAVSADGRVVVGDYLNVTAGARDAFRWTAETGMAGLGAFAASAVSDDGSVVVGTLAGGPTFEAFRWTEAAGIVPLGTLGPDNESRARGVSRDGSRVVGYITSTLDDSSQAFIWDAEHGMRLLKDVLVQDCGLDLTGWKLTQAWDVSNNGPTIVGRGYNPQGVEEAWQAVLPEPATLALLGLGALAIFRRRTRPTPR